MNIVLRSVAFCALALLVQPAFAATSPAVLTPGGTGNFLAGQQAMNALRTPDAARFLHDAALDQWDNTLVLGRSFSALAADGQIDDAVATARHLLQLDPSDEMARLVMATEAIKQRRYDAAITDLGRLSADTSFEGVTGAVLKSWALIGAGKPDDAFKALDRVSDSGLQDFLVFHRAIMAELAGHTPDAIKNITQAHDADPYSADVVEAYARILGNAGQFGPAIDDIVAFEAQGLSSPLVTAVKQSLAKSQRPGLYADSVQAGAAEMFRTVGVAFARENSNDVALVLLRLGQYLNPRNDSIALVIGQLYDGANQHDLANAVYDTIGPTSPMRAMATVRIANNLDAMGNRSEAISRLGNIVTLDPTDIEAISVLGGLYQSDKQYQAAADTYTRALGVSGGQSPGDWRFYYLRGIAFERSNQFPLAEKDFLEALKLNPGQPQVLNYLGYSWVDKGMYLNRALDMIQKAVTASPNDGYIIDSLGWAYYRLGRFDDAVNELEQAALLRPNDPEINDHLGDAYWKVGRKLEAHFQWNVAYSLDTEGDVKARVAPKLKGGLDAAPQTGDSAPIIAAPAGQATTN